MFLFKPKGALEIDFKSNCWKSCGDNGVRQKKMVNSDSNHT